MEIESHYYIVALLVHLWQDSIYIMEIRSLNKGY